MEVLGKVNYRHQPLVLSLHHRRSFSRPITSSVSFRTPLLSSSLKYPFSSSIKASSSSSSSESEPLLPNPKLPKPQLFQTLNPFPFSLLKTTFIAAITATALFYAHARFNLKPLIAGPISPPTTVETTASSEPISEEEIEKEKTLEERVISQPDDVQTLRNLMEEKIKGRKIQEAISIIDQLIKLEPNDIEWPLLKSHMYCYSGELELAKLGFTDILSKDPFRVEAYHGLVMAASHAESGRELKQIEKKIEEALDLCKREKKEEDLRDFKLLIGQIRVIEGNYNDALKVYQELVNDEPRDFRPYLCQGIIYTLLKKKDEADKHFQKYQSLVPKGHPYAQFLDDNMTATKVFAQKVENERLAGSRR